jgi:hypothetical protein
MLIVGMSHMVCKPHQYTLMKMAMPTYESALAYAPQIYSVSQNYNKNFTQYQSEFVPQTTYTSNTLSRDDYTAFTQTAPVTWSEPRVAFDSLTDQPLQKSSAIEYIPQQSAQDKVNANVYSLPFYYKSNNFFSLDKGDKVDKNANMKEQLSQLIQRELLNLQLQVHHV